MHIRITYYAVLRDCRGLDREDLTTDVASLQQLYRDLARAHAFPVDEAHVRPAINDEFCAWDRPVHDGDHVVFIPPVAGG